MNCYPVGESFFQINESISVLGKEEHNLLDNNLEKMFEHLKQMLQEMRFGSITLVVQDGKVIQLDKVEKVRLK
jgi:hypothetical protein